MQKYMYNVGFGICKILIKLKIPILNLYFCNLMMTSIVGSKPRFNIYDIRKKCDFPPLCYDMSELDKYLNDPEVQKELNVPGRKWEACSVKVEEALLKDFVTNAGPMVTNVLKRNIPVLIYNGDKDFICNWEGS